MPLIAWQLHWLTFVILLLEQAHLTFVLWNLVSQ